MQLILLGPPGAGKGTQAKILSKEFKIPHISTGDILRDEVRENSALGHKVAELVRSGELVPDEIVVKVVINRLTKPDAGGGFILDGFPRTLNQAEQLNTALSRLNSSIDLVIYFKTNPEVSIRRLSGRRVCKNLGANFHIINKQPKKESICDLCKVELILREDDKEETVKRRLAIYQRQTANLIDYYRKSGKLRQVCGDLEAGKVYTELIDLFAREDLKVPLRRHFNDKN